MIIKKLINLEIFKNHSCHSISEPFIHLHFDINSTAGCVVLVPLAIFEGHVHSQVPGHEHDAQNIGAVVLAKVWAMVKVVSALVSHIRCYIQSLCLLNQLVSLVIVNE